MNGEVSSGHGRFSVTFRTLEEGVRVHFRWPVIGGLMTFGVLAMVWLAHPVDLETPQERELLILRCLVLALGVLAPALAIFGDTYHPNKNRSIHHNITPLGWISINLMIVLLVAGIGEAWLEHKFEIEDEKELKIGHDKISIAVGEVRKRVDSETGELDEEVQLVRQGLGKSISASEDGFESLTQTVESEVMDVRSNLKLQHAGMNTGFQQVATQFQEHDEALQLAETRLAEGLRKDHKQLKSGLGEEYQQQQAIILARHGSLSEEFQRLQYDVDDRIHTMDGNVVALRDAILLQEDRLEELLTAIDGLQKRLSVDDDSRETED